MSGDAYSRGYEEGYQDGLHGRSGPVPHLLDFLTDWDESQREYERGYNDGWAAGDAERQSQKGG